MTPNQLFTDAFYRMISGWAEVRTFREVSEAGLDSAGPKVEQRQLESIRLLASRPDFPKFLRDFDAINELGLEGVAKRTAEGSVVSARAAVDAASLVFAHTITDACATRFLRVTAMIAPDDWGRILGDKQLRVADLRQHGYERALRDLVFEEMERIEKNEFFVKKVRKLRQLCSPQEDWILPMKYDESQLIEIHNRRRNVVHGDHFGQGKPQAIPTIEADLDFLKNLGEYFFVIVAKRYKVKLLAEDE
jgi:hypothetical protein